ncbi:MAG: hypothetical protein AAB855_03565 [Patescibacteria group bacterium]|mgnify:CR=1 FL=1
MWKKYLPLIVILALAVVVAVVAVVMKPPPTPPAPEQEALPAETGEFPSGGVGEEAVPPAEISLPPLPSEPAPDSGAVAPAQVVVTYDGGAFIPAVVTIRRGEGVTFVNRSSQEAWPASALHPTHAVYPGSDIKKCGTDAKIFDACRSLSQGESWSFVFDEVGSWKYHNHTNPGAIGTVIVQ